MFILTLPCNTNNPHFLGPEAPFFISHIKGRHNENTAFKYESTNIE